MGESRRFSVRRCYSKVHRVGVLVTIHVGYSQECAGDDDAARAALYWAVCLLHVLDLRRGQLDRPRRSS